MPICLHFLKMNWNYDPTIYETYSATYKTFFMKTLHKVENRHESESIISNFMYFVESLLVNFFFNILWIISVKKTSCFGTEEVYLT